MGAKPTLEKAALVSQELIKKNELKQSDPRKGGT
jgi:hypothetical protein